MLCGIELTLCIIYSKWLFMIEKDNNCASSLSTNKTAIFWRLFCRIAKIFYFCEPKTV